jgi:hypothetical protein
MTGATVVLLFAAVVVASGHLCVGIAIGWAMGRRVAGVAEPFDLEPFATSVDSIRSQVSQLSQRASEAPSSDPMFASIIARLTLSLDELHRALTSPAKTTAPNSAEPANEPSHQMGTHAVGNGRLLEWFQGTRPMVVPVIDAGRRYPFAVQQFVAERRNVELPQPGEFVRVQCHDISPSEVRYLVENRPKFPEVVIALGMPRPVKFVTAQIEDYRSVYMYGRVGYLVTAKFEESIDHPPYVKSFRARAEEEALAAT